MHMAPGEPYLTEKNEGLWLCAGPHRKYERMARSESTPVYYADWLTVEGRPGVSGKLFNCLTEIRDVAGYEWAPDNNVAATVERGVRQLRRALDSHCLASLFTHESDYIQNVKPENWQAIMEGIAAQLTAYAPRYATADDGYRYVRARSGIRLADVVVTAEQVALDIEGRSDVATTARLFVDADDGAIDEREVEVPAVEGKARVVVA
jgi:hypothetical protein